MGYYNVGSIEVQVDFSQSSVMITAMLNQVVLNLCNLVYPPHCLICNKPFVNRFPREWLCLHCQQLIQRNHPPCCLKCSRHLREMPHAPVCASCQNKKIAFDFAWAACLYEEPLNQLIYQFKYRQKSYLHHYFSKLLIHCIHTNQFDIHQFDYIIPIPLFSTRLRERGYNQAQLLAQDLATYFNIPLCCNQLFKARPTQVQAQLNEKERWTNLRGAFRIKHPEIFNQKRVLIIDDLLTTGATCSEAAYLFKKANAKIAAVMTLAITPS